MDKTSSITTNMPRRHSLHAHHLYLYPAYILIYPYALMKIPFSAACLYTCKNRPTHPVGHFTYRSLLIAPVNHLQFTTDITRGPTGHHQHLSITAGNRPPLTSLAPQITGGYMACHKLARGANLHLAKL